MCRHLCVDVCPSDDAQVEMAASFTEKSPSCLFIANAPTERTVGRQTLVGKDNMILRGKLDVQTSPLTLTHRKENPSEGGGLEHL